MTLSIGRTDSAGADSGRGNHAAGESHLPKPTSAGPEAHDGQNSRGLDVLAFLLMKSLPRFLPSTRTIDAILLRRHWGWN